MLKRFSTFLVLGLCAIALGLLAKSNPSGVALAQEQPGASAAPAANDFLDNIPLTIVFDVATDARTFRINRGASLPEAKRGDSFIVEGKIYPGGAIPPGGTFQSPGAFDSTGLFNQRFTFRIKKQSIR